MKVLNWEIQRQEAMKQRDLLLAKLVAAKIPFMFQHEDVLVKTEELTKEQQDIVDKIIQEFIEERRTNEI